MKRCRTLSLAALSLSVLALANSPQTFAQSPDVAQPPHMVPARAALNASIAANKVKPGDEFRATLAEKVQLQNGPRLPAGTILIGQVSTDDTNQAGASKLALRFTSAKLKDGQTVPIKATIVGVLPTGFSNEDSYRLNPNSQVPATWNDGTLVVDQIDAMNGVDLHSRIASQNSGVFVSTKDNIKLANGGELELAIAQQQPSTSQARSTNGNQ